MKPLKLYITEVLASVYDQIKAAVDTQVFIDNRPTAIPEQMSDFIVISLPVGLQNQGVLQDGKLEIEIVVRLRKSNAQPNLPRLQAMTDIITAMFPMKSSDGRWCATRPTIALRGNDNAGFSIWNIRADIVVNTTDRLTT